MDREPSDLKMAQSRNRHELILRCSTERDRQPRTFWKKAPTFWGSEPEKSMSIVVNRSMPSQRLLNILWVSADTVSGLVSRGAGASRARNQVAIVRLFARSATSIDCSGRIPKFRNVAQRVGSITAAFHILEMSLFSWRSRIRERVSSGRSSDNGKLENGHEGWVAWKF